MDQWSINRKERNTIDFKRKERENVKDIRVLKPNNMI